MADSNLNIVRLSQLTRLHASQPNDLLHVSRGDTDYYMAFSDLTGSINEFILPDDSKWNASKLVDVPIAINDVKDMDTLIYSDASNSFESRRITFSDVSWENIGTANGIKYLKVVDGELTESRVGVQELEPSGVGAAGKYLRVSSDGTSVFEDTIPDRVELTSSVIPDLLLSGTTIGRVTPTTVDRPANGVGFAYVAKLPDSEAKSILFIDTATGAIKARVHNGQTANPSDIGAYYDVFNSITNPLSSSITSTSETNIANSLAVKLVNDRVNTTIQSVTSANNALSAHKTSGDHDSRYYNKAYIDQYFARISDISDASNLIAGYLDNARLRPTISSNTTGNAATATRLSTSVFINNRLFNASSNVVVDPYIEREDTTNATRYIPFVGDVAAGYQQLRIDNGLTYNPATNNINAGAARWATARRINNIPVDGSADVVVPPPVGFVYTQYPNTANYTSRTPAEAFGGVWTEIDYAGAFFRSKGGNALPFNAGTQGDAIRNITGRFEGNSDDGHAKLGAFYVGDRASGANGNTSQYGAFIHFDASRVVPTASENRPINVTVRLWVRTA